MPNLGIIIGLALFFLLAWYRREWGIYLIVLGLPAYQIRFQAFGIPATFLEGMILVLAAVEFLHFFPSPGVPLGHELEAEWGRVRERSNESESTKLWNILRRDKPISLFILLFLLAAGISIFTGPNTFKAAGIFKAYFLEAVLFYFLVRLIIDSPGKLQKLFNALAVLVLYLSVFGLYQYLTLANLPFSWWDVGFDERRIVSFLNHPNGLALLLGPILALMIMLPKNKLRWAAIATGLIAFYLTLSRAGWLALVATTLIFGLLQFKKNNPPSPPLKLRGGWGALSLLIIVIVILTIPVSRNKILSLAGADPSKQNRYVLWSAAADILKKHPVAGVGLMGFREAYKSYPLGPDRVIQNYPHNFFLNFWLETGLLGLLSMIGLLALFAKKIRNLLRTEYQTYALAFGAAMSMIILHSLVDVSYFKNDLSILFWLIYSFPFLNFRFD